MLREKAIIMNSDDMERVFKRIVNEIIEKNRGTENIALVGIQRRGVFLAKHLQNLFKKQEKVKIPAGELDITLYRDDLTLLHEQPVVQSTSIPFDVNGTKVVLVDDVIYTGRTVRAALDALMDLGRPSVVQLAVLIDRGHRELPIQPDYCGKKVPTSSNEIVEVRVEEIDGKNDVVICEKDS
jgi:pyrimidine operon attenuation protein/uracil phosphoribosyltransferase